MENITLASHKKGNIYLLRHEQRGSSVSFDSPLIQSGLDNSINIICPKLERRKIDIIYSSPFVRALQTIQPFCRKTKIKVNLEWSLVESMPIDPEIPDDFDDMIDMNYKPVIGYYRPLTTDMINFDEIKYRMRNFIDSLDKSKNILLVTHMPVINSVLSYKGIKHIEMYTQHPPGAIISVNKISAERKKKRHRRSNADHYM